MFRWGTGWDYLTVGDAEEQLSRLYYYDFPSGPAPSSVTISASGRFPGSKAMRLGAGTNADPKLSKLIDGDSMDHFYLGIAAYIPSADLNVVLPAIGVALDGETKLQVQFDDFGKLKLYMGRGPSEFGDPGTLLATSQAMKYTNDAWLFIELGGLLSLTTSGWCTVRINTVPVIELVSSVTALVTAGFNSVQWTNNGEPGPGFSTDGPSWDDCYLNDSSGSYNNSWSGNTRAQALLPAAPGAVTTWTPEPISMPNWQAASNIALDDSTYVYSAVDGAYDLYEITPILNSPEIFAVQVMGAYRQDDATQRFVRNLMLSGAALTEGSSYATNSTYSFTQPDIYEINPDTGTTWTYTEVNLIEIGPSVSGNDLLDVGDGFVLDVGGTGFDFLRVT